MSEHPRHEDLQVLGLPAYAAPAEVARAYRELKELYGEESLATYSLFVPEEREAYLGHIAVAHARVGAQPTASAPPSPSPKPTPPEPTDVDPAESPGTFLRRCREARGLTLQDVAGETKIGSRYLQNIEQEDFEHLPVRVYLRGFLIAYAKTLRLPKPEELTAHYLQKFESESRQDA